ncbi:lymphocyte antigen 6D [Orycteropus afer afer]|uniref:Lymphocyte antigen 6D n=1 Tax=Orycteropus afer afer TaxID=1230840 RepID=A0A8B6ZSL1_ORYAF|nr:lymphocyte antigen 6D [Orycteropus afer afer]
MKSALLLLVLLAMAAGPAQALQCHVCINSSNCKKAQTCPANSRFCRTVTTLEPLSGNLVNKDCAESCTPSSTHQGQVSSGSATTQCCQGDLCNESLAGASTLARATLGLVLALGLLALIL